MWDISSGSETKTATFTQHNGNVNCCDKLLNGNVVSGGSDNDLFIWNPANGNTVASKSDAHSSDILCLKVYQELNICTILKSSYMF